MLFVISTQLPQWSVATCADNAIIGRYHLGVCGPGGENV